MKPIEFSAKKITYVIMTVVLGHLCGLLIFVCTSILFTKQKGVAIEFVQVIGPIYSPLPATVFWTLMLAGAVGGFFLGLNWWRLVYVEHRHWRQRRGR